MEASCSVWHLVMDLSNLLPARAIGRSGQQLISPGRLLWYVPDVEPLGPRVAIQRCLDRGRTPGFSAIRADLDLANAPRASHGDPAYVVRPGQHLSPRPG